MFRFAKAAELLIFSELEVLEIDPEGFVFTAASIGFPAMVILRFDEEEDGLEFVLLGEVDAVAVDTTLIFEAELIFDSLLIICGR